MLDDAMFLMIIVGMGLAIAYIRAELLEARGSRVSGHGAAGEQD